MKLTISFTEALVIEVPGGSIRVSVNADDVTNVAWNRDTSGAVVDSNDGFKQVNIYLTPEQRDQKENQTT